MATPPGHGAPGSQIPPQVLVLTLTSSREGWGRHSPCPQNPGTLSWTALPIRTLRQSPPEWGRRDREGRGENRKKRGGVLLSSLRPPGRAACPPAPQAPSEGGGTEGARQPRARGVSILPRAGQTQLAASVGTIPGPRQPHSGQSVGIGAAANARAAGHVPRGGSRALILLEACPDLQADSRVAEGSTERTVSGPPPALPPPSAPPDPAHPSASPPSTCSLQPRSQRPQPPPTPARLPPASCPLLPTSWHRGPPGPG